jgi:cytochrome c oxidase assembly factor CtaG
VAALILSVACLVPPVSSLAGRYVVAETAQFVVFAMIAPALLVLAAPWPLLGLGDRAAQLARSRLRHPSFTRSLGFLAIFAVATACWRLPAVIDAVARHHILGLATHGVFLAFRYLPGGPLSAVADQELATAVLWAVAGVCFMPVVLVSALRGLHEDEDVDSELERAASATTLPPVRGWGQPRTGKARSI